MVGVAEEVENQFETNLGGESDVQQDDVQKSDDVEQSDMDGGKKRKQTRGKKAKKGKKSKKVKKSKKSKKVKKPKRAKTAKRSGKKNYLSFCAMYAKKHGFPNARAVMKNPQCKAAFHAQ